MNGKRCSSATSGIAASPVDRGGAGGRLQAQGKPFAQRIAGYPSDIDFGANDTLPSQRQQNPGAVGEPQMWIGESSQLVPVVLERLMVAGLPDLDRQQIFGHAAAMHHDIGVDRLSEFIVGGDNARLRQPPDPLPEPI